MMSIRIFLAAILAASIAGCEPADPRVPHDPAGRPPRPMTGDGLHFRGPGFHAGPRIVPGEGIKISPGFDSGISIGL